MKTYLIFDFKRAVFSWKTLIALLMILLFFIKSYHYENWIPHPGADGINSFIRVGMFSYLPFLAPLIACIPYSNSYILDNERGVFNKLFTVIEPKAYFISRLIVNALVSGFVFLLAQTVFLVFLICSYGINDIHLDVVGAFSQIYYSSKIAYIIIIILISSLSAASFSTFILGISTLIKSKFLIFLLPLFYVIVTGIIFESIGIAVGLNVMALFDMGIKSTSIGINVILYDLVLFLAGSFLFYCFGYKKVIGPYKNEIVA